MTGKSLTTIFVLSLLGTLIGCSDDCTGEVFERVTGSGLRAGQLLVECSNFPFTDGSSIQIYALPATNWSPGSGLAPDHPLPTEYEKSWVRQTWKQGSLQQDQPILSKMAFEAIEFAAQGECSGQRGRESAEDAVRAATRSKRAYYAFLHKKEIAPDQIPVLRLYMIDESQSIFLMLFDDR